MICGIDQWGVVVVFLPRGSPGLTRDNLFLPMLARAPVRSATSRERSTDKEGYRLHYSSAVPPADTGEPPVEDSSRLSLRMDSPWIARTGLLLALIVLAALGLRLYGIGFGRDIRTPLEFSYHRDEPESLVKAVNMAETLHLNPEWFHYPSLLLYTNVALFRALALFGTFDPYIAGRALTALFGSLTVLLAYFLGRYLCSQLAGLAGAGLLAVCFLHVRSSHFLTTDVPMAFWSTLAALAAARHVQSGSSRALWACFGCAGLAAGTKYNGATAVLLGVAATLVRRPGPWNETLRKMVAGLAISVAAFLATTPFALLELKAFWDSLDYIHTYQTTGHYGFERGGVLENFGFLTYYIFSKGFGPGGSLLALSGALLILIPPRRSPGLPLVVWSGTYLLFIASYRTSFVRHLMPLLPLLAVFAGVALQSCLVWLRQRLPRAPLARSSILAALLVISAVPAFIDSLRYDRAIANSTRTESIPWILENIPPGSRIASERYGPPIHLTHPDRYRIEQISNFGTRLLSSDWFRAAGIQYIISSSASSEMAFSNPERYPEAESRYREIDQLYLLIKVFQGDRVDPLYDSISPTIKIYRVQRGEQVFRGFRPFNDIPGPRTDS